MKKTWVAASLGFSLVLASGVYAQHGHDHGHAHGHAASTPASTEKGSNHVSIEKCWIRLMPSVTPSGGFFEFENKDTSQVAVLKGIETDAFGKTMLHRSYTKEGQAGMEMVHDVVVKAAEKVHFKPGDYHAMLEQPVAGLKVGDQIKVDFILGTGDKVPVSCVLKSVNTLTFDDK